MRRRFALLALPLLGACDPYESPDVIAQATQPSYIVAPSGYVVPSVCRDAQRSGYSRLPSGCQRDLILAQQVANRGDLINPVKPGRPPATPIGAAANEYVFGTAVPSGGGGTNRAPGTLTQVGNAGGAARPDQGGGSGDGG